MPIDPLIAIHAELAQIKLIILIVGSVVGVLAFLAIVGRVLRLPSEVRSFVQKQFGRDACKLFDENKLLQLKVLCNDTLGRYPNHASAHWYLARVFLAEGKLDASAHEFDVLRRICPNWDAEYIAPYTREIARLRADQAVN